MSTGGAGGPARPNGTEPGTGPDPAPGPGEASAPWERPSRWAHDRTEATRVEDLLARLSVPDTGLEPRRRRRGAADDAGSVAAGDLIAALSSNAPPQREPASAVPAPGGPADLAEPPGPAGAGGPGVPAGGAEPAETGPSQADGSDAGGRAERDPDATTVLATVPDGRPEQDAPPPGDSSPDSSWESVLASLRRQNGTAATAAEGASAGGARIPPFPAGAAHADHPHRGWLIAGRSLVAVLAALLVLITGTEWMIKARADAVLADRKITAISPDDTNISTPTAIPTSGAGAPEAIAGGGRPHQAGAPPPAYRAENILLMGSDTRASAADAKLGGSGTTTMQSDVLMVAHLSADRSHVTVVSIPRDLYIKAPTCKAWDYQTNSLSDKDYVTPYSVWKITNAYSVGGPQCTVRAVQKLTGLRIDRVIIIDFAGFKAMVDALGGITVNACRPIIDSNPAIRTVLPRAGKQHIDGTQALKLVRARHVYGDTRSDLARIHRQQQVLSILLRQASSAGVLLNPAKLNAFLQAFVHHTRTDNVTLDDLLNIAQSLGNLDPSRVTFYTLPTVPSSDGEGLEMTSAGPKIWNALVNDRPLPGEITAPPAPASTHHSRSTEHRSTGSTAVSATPITTVITHLVTSTPHPSQVVSEAPGDVHLQVVNVAGRGGVATMAMNALVPLGFDIGEPDLLLIPGDVREGITVEYSSGNRAAALTVAAAVPGATLVQQPGLGDLVRLMLGSSFDGTVQQVSVGSPVPAALSTTPSPLVSTVLSTRVTTPSAAPPTTGRTTATPTTSDRPTRSTPTASSLSGVESVNAGNDSCI